MWRREIEIPKHTMVIVLDGTGSDLLLRRVLGDDLEVIDARCERNARVTQISDTTMSKTRLLGGRAVDEPLNDRSKKAAERERKRMATFANMLPQQHGGEAFVCTYKPVEKALVQEGLLGPEVMLDHFGGFRGSNDYKTCVAAVIIGREQTWPRTVEDVGRAVFHDDPKPLKLTGEYVKVKRGIRMRDGSAVEVEVTVHPDPRVQAALETIREDEITQAIDRIRLIHNVEPKHVYIVTNVPCDVTVDRVVTFDELFHEITGQIDNGQAGTGRRLYGDRLVEAFRRGNGVLPRAPSELVRLYGDLWTSPDTAKESLKRGTLQIEPYWQVPPST